MPKTECTFEEDLKSLRTPFTRTAYHAVVRALGEGLQSTEHALEGRLQEEGRADERSDSQLTDLSAEKECLIGLIYAACQCHIDAVAGKAMRINERLQQQKILPMSKQDKRGLTELCRAIYSDTPLSKITAIDVFASYFKHRDKWPNRWSSLEGGVTRTIKDIRFVGLAYTAADNLTRSVRGFELQDGRFTVSLVQLLDEWTACVHAYAEAELRDRNVL
ncbi:MAG: hypothetical protein HY291_02085 [Planctomycetes bacterium]|nr:hypothetical protein [Planctomycetota bacterium]